MKTATKIRWLLLLVTIGLFATSLTARWATTKLVNLYDIADKITAKLGAKETIIYDYLHDSKKFNDLKKVDKNAKLATTTIDYFIEEGVYFQTYKNNELSFWSDAIISPENVEELKEGTSFVNYSNGWYETLKKKEGNFFVVFFIPVKFDYPYRNQYLSNGFEHGLIIDKTIDIASLSDSAVADIKSIEGRYLFSIKKNEALVSKPYSVIEISVWILGFITLALLINSICKYYADMGYPGQAASLLILCFALLRYLGLKYHFPDAIYSLKLFDPAIYASNFYFPSFADLCLNVVMLLWVMVFIYSYKNKIFRFINNPWVGYPILFYGVILLTILSFSYSDIFFGLIFNSNINFKVSNLVSLNWLSYFGILILMTALLCYYLIIDILITFSSFISIGIRKKLILLGLIFIGFNIYEIFSDNYSVFFILTFALVLIIGRLVYHYNGKIVFPALLLISLIFATLVSIKLNRFQSVKETEVRKQLLLKLESADNPYAIIAFYDIEKDLAKDEELKKMLKDGEADNKEIDRVFNDFYVSGYLSKFDYHVYLFNDKDSLMSSGRGAKLKTYQQAVEGGSFKVTNNFYRLNNSFGSQDYFAIIPIKEKGEKLGTVVIELRSKELERYGAFPQLFQNNDFSPKVDLAEYSYAFYENKKLVNQYGNFVYDLLNIDFRGKYKDFVILKKGGYDHIIYKPEKNNTIVITHPSDTFWRELASLSFFFIIFLVFSLLIISYKWIWKSLISYELGFRNLKLNFFIINNKLLYKTRIQIALVLAVVSSLIIIGIITFSYISIQYKDQQQDLIRNKIKIIAQAFQENINHDVQSVQGKSDNISFEEFSRMYNTDLNLFDYKGKLLFSTQYKIYALGLIADRMNAEAYVNLNLMHKSEFIQDENIDKLKFTSAYMPIRNLQNNVVAYLQLPYFANQEDYNQKIGTFLNLLINIYVLVFVAIGFFAFVVANQITGPLSLIQESLSKTMIGRTNKPIAWTRNDEIGSLVREYNAMIKTLEENANKLAQSERETAWREMAKQVAHEIKNPLTPLRLGIQMLGRSWKDRDMNFDEKFQRFSTSFLDQIDSLSRIASEFSNFAKMPELKLEQFDLLDVLDRAIEVYGQTSHIHIKCNGADFKNCRVKADKDQLLRSFNNLLKNAIEATPEGKEGVIKITGKKIDHKIEISVRDNGNGIPFNSRERIFVPNFTTKSSGTGLGLAFVKQAVENVGGNIYFTTQIDEGTTFYILLPLVN